MRSAVARWLLAILACLGASSARPAALDTNALKTIAPIEVIRLATTRYWIMDFVDDEDRRRKDLSEIGSLDPDVQTLVWLAVLEHAMTEQTEANNFAPSQLIGAERSYSDIHAALLHANMIERAKAFAHATAFRPVQSTSQSIPRFSGPVDLGRSFGTKAAFDDAMVAYVRSRPKAAAWLDDTRANLSDEDRLFALRNMLWHQDAPDLLQTWPEPYRVLLLADMFDGEVRNGGVNQYFYNSSGDTAPAAAQAMRTLGLPKQAEAIERGIGLFPSPYPTDTETRRREFNSADAKARNAALDALTDVVGYEAVRAAMIAYARQHDLLPR